MPHAVELIVSHILERLTQPRTRPLFVAIQGPQGSGKSFLTNLVQNELTSKALKVASLSIDDLYLPHDSLVALSSSDPSNILWRGRGQPGTHDIPLAVQILNCLDSGVEEVRIPMFDKSLFDGEGDRLPIEQSCNVISAPVDVVIMEGWCMGFGPISPTELDLRWSGSWEHEKKHLNLQQEALGSKDHLLKVNTALIDYVKLWSFFNVFIQLHPKAAAEGSVYSVVYTWRLQQEHHMKARNGGRGMTDAAVKLFIDRYIPGYVFFGDAVTAGYAGLSGEDTVSPPPWLGQSLRICLDEKREVVGVQKF